MKRITKTYLVQQFIGNEWHIYTVKASTKKEAKVAAIAKGADASKRMSVK